MTTRHYPTYRAIKRLHQTHLPNRQRGVSSTKGSSNEIYGKGHQSSIPTSMVVSLTSISVRSSFPPADSSSLCSKRQQWSDRCFRFKRRNDHQFSLLDWSKHARQEWRHERSIGRKDWNFRRSIREFGSWKLVAEARDRCCKHPLP